MNLINIEYIELYVSNALKSAGFYRDAFGFSIVGYGSPDTGLSDKISYILKSGSCRLVLSSGIDSGSTISTEVALHDDFVKDIAFNVEDVKKTFNHAMAKGAQGILEPTICSNGEHNIIKATINSFGNVNHSFIQGISTTDLLPFYRPLNRSNVYGTRIKGIDHIAFAVRKGMLDRVSKFYKNALNFHLLYKEDIDLGSSGMRSVVMASKDENIKVTIVEPISNTEISQVEKFITNNNNIPGVQHIAFASEDIIDSVKRIKENGIGLLHIPKEYYRSISSSLRQKLGESVFHSIEQFEILVDEDNNGQLFQVFTKPLQNRETFFAEIIERRGAKTFGSRNIKALYKAVQGL
jgi:4-hydroxyphenylpyruvate dioxygenase